jgi:hypothetical protein
MWGEKEGHAAHNQGTTEVTAKAIATLGIIGRKYLKHVYLFI